MIDKCLEHAARGKQVDWVICGRAYMKRLCGKVRNDNMDMKVIDCSARKIGPSAAQDVRAVYGCPVSVPLNLPASGQLELA